MIVPIQFVLALVMALIVNAKVRGRGLFLAIFILPLAISDLAAGLVWQAILTERGYLNTVLQKVGLIDQEYIWLDPTKSNHLLIAVVVAELWRSTAFVMVIFLAGLQGIPHEYTEAAEVFGAGFFQRVRQVILPLLKPSIQVALLFRIIFAFEAFAVVLAPPAGPRPHWRPRPGAGKPSTSTATPPRRTRRSSWSSAPGCRIVIWMLPDAPGTDAAMRRGGHHLPAASRVAAEGAHYIVGIVLSCGFSPPLRDHARCFSSEEDVYDYPKRLLPQDLSTETMRFFLDFPGMTDALWRSASSPGHARALARDRHACGYALARFAFGRGHGAALGRRH